MGSHPMRRRMLLVALLVAGISLACGEAPELTALRQRADAFDGEALEPQLRGAWRRLKTTSYYGSVLSVATWGPVTSASDTCTLWHAGEADALIHLALTADLGGRLWAMRGLQYLDPDSFDVLALKLAEDASFVETMHGCFGGKSSFDVLLRDEVLGEEELYREYESRFDEPEDRATLMEWSLKARGEANMRCLNSDPGKAAFDRLDAATYVGDSNTAFGKDFELLLEEEAFPFRAAAMLAVSPRPEVRYWGAWALYRLAPPAFQALTSFWEEDDTPLTCHWGAEHEEHTLAEAIALHVN